MEKDQSLLFNYQLINPYNMRICIKILLLLLLPVLGIAQDKVVTISPAMFDQTLDRLLMGNMDQWIFKQGNDTAWAKKNIDISGWKKLKPTELSAKYADKNGKAECWFRIKIKLDKAFGNRSFGIKSATWAACDLYVNGYLAASFGNTGNNGSPFHEYHPGKLPVPVNLKAGNEYTIALHFVDYIAPIPPRRLRSEDAGLVYLLQLTGPKYVPYFLLDGVKVPTVFDTILISICTILSLLFWLLFLQNPFEKNLRLISLGSVVWVLVNFCESASDYFDLSYAGYTFYNIASSLFTSISFIMPLIIVVNIFKRTMSAGLKSFL